MKVVVIIQARMTSTRLPGKVLKPILGAPMLVRQIERVRRIQGIHKIVVATTAHADAQPIVDCVATLPDVGLFRGAEDDVLDRYYQAARCYEAEAIVRITSDCPLIDPDVSSRVVAQFLQSAGNVDYASNCLLRTYPRGLDTEIFSMAALYVAWCEAARPFEREHVTPFVWQQAERFRLLNIVSDDDYSHFRWTVDTMEDLTLVNQIYTALYPRNPHFVLTDILALFTQHPELQHINQHVRQKALQ